jgi:hypothetical protein
MANFFGDLTKKLIVTSTPVQQPGLAPAQAGAAITQSMTQAYQPKLQQMAQENITREYAPTDYRLNLIAEVGNDTQKQFVDKYRQMYDSGQAGTDQFKQMRSSLANPEMFPGKSELEKMWMLNARKANAEVLAGQKNQAVQATMAKDEYDKKFNAFNSALSDFKTSAQMMRNIDVQQAQTIFNRVSSLQNVIMPMTMDAVRAGKATGFVTSVFNDLNDIKNQDIMQAFQPIVKQKEQLLQKIQTVNAGNPMLQKMQGALLLYHISQIPNGTEDNSIAANIGAQIFGNAVRKADIKSNDFMTPGAPELMFNTIVDDVGKAALMINPVGKGGTYQQILAKELFNDLKDQAIGKKPSFLAKGADMNNMPAFINAFLNSKEMQDYISLNKDNANVTAVYDELQKASKGL